MECSIDDLSQQSECEVRPFLTVRWGELVSWTLLGTSQAEEPDRGNYLPTLRQDAHSSLPVRLSPHGPDMQTRMH